MEQVNQISLKLLGNIPAMLRQEVLPYSVSREEFIAVAPDLFKRRIDGLYYRQFAPQSPQQALYRSVHAAQYSAFKEILAATSSVDVPVCAYKGLNYVHNVLDGEPINMMHDIDLVVHRADIQRIKSIMHSKGYAQGDLVHETLQILQPSYEYLEAHDSEAYELYAFTRIDDINNAGEVSLIQGPIYRATSDLGEFSRSRTAVAISFDFHISPSSDIGPEVIWKRALNTQALDFLCTDLTVQVWLSALRYYTEVALNQRRRNIRELAYMIAAITRHQLDWDVLVELTHSYQTHPPIWYTLKFLQDIFHLTVPSNILDTLHPQLGNRTFDFGWQYPKLFGLIDLLPRTELLVGLT